MNAILRLCRLIGMLFSTIYPIKIAHINRRFKREIYSGFISGRLKKSGAIFAGNINLVGGKYITIGSNTFIGKDVRLWAWDNFKKCKYSPSIIIGENTSINSGCMLSCINKIIIGNDVGIASNCVIIDNTHGDFRDHKYTFNNNPDVPDVFLQAAHDRDLYSKGPVIIEDGVHLGEGAIIMPGVRIGHHSVISAQTVVTKNVQPYSIVAGNPAMVVISFGKAKIAK